MVNDKHGDHDGHVAPEVVVAGLGWLAGLIVIACYVGPGWAAALLGITAAIFAANVAYHEWRITRRTRTVSDETGQSRHIEGLSPAVRELEITVRDLERDWARHCDTTLIPEAELTTFRGIMRRIATGLLTLMSAILAVAVHGVVLLSPSIAIGLTLWWCWHVSLFAAAAGLAALPVGHVLTQWWPRDGARLRESIHQTVLRLTPLA